MKAIHIEAGAILLIVLASYARFARAVFEALS